MRVDNSIYTPIKTLLRYAQIALTPFSSSPQTRPVRAVDGREGRGGRVSGPGTYAIRFRACRNNDI